MDVKTELSFDDPEVASFLDAADSERLDALEFGVIGFDAATNVQVYNAWESRCAGLSVARVVDQPLFTHVAPCMNNYMVAQRFESAVASGQALDDTIDYVLTLRMRPTKVRLRLIAEPGMRLCFLLVNRDVR